MEEKTMSQGDKAYYEKLFIKQGGMKTRSGKAVYISKEYQPVGGIKPVHT
jgi:hypothetical protein